MTANRVLKVAVTGAQGQVARALLERMNMDIETIALARPEFDLLSPGQIAAQIAALKPDVVINAAAWTAVDDAETHEDEAFAVNERGAEAVAAGAEAAGAPVLHLSTDYVFAGDKLSAYVEDDVTRPRSAYGRSKLAGEKAVIAANSRAIVLRTSWVYARGGKNFVATMLRLAGQRNELGVVDDQRGRPTYAPHIAVALHEIARRVAGAGWQPAYGGIFHMAGADMTSWRGFAEAIFAASRAHGGPSARVNAIATADYPTPATRPANSDLDCSKLARVFGIALPGVGAGLEDYFAQPVDTGRPPLRSRA